MKHYIIVKFNKDYDYISELDNIKSLFNESLKIHDVKKVNIYVSNSKLSNRQDLMIEMELTQQALIDFDNSWIHKKWKDDYAKYIETKTIFDCD